MRKNKTVRVSEEELALLTQLRERQVDVASVVQSPVAKEAASENAIRSQATSELAAALTEAIKATKGPEKKNVFTRVKNTPWTPKDGSPRLKPKRVFMHHGLELGSRVSNEEIALLNKIRPGYYCEGFVKVVLRKDRSIDIDYPVKTASQRLRLVNQFGIRNFKELLQRIVDERISPSKYRRPEDLEFEEDNVKFD